MTVTSNVVKSDSQMTIVLLEFYYGMKETRLSFGRLSFWLKLKLVKMSKFNPSCKRAECWFLTGICSIPWFACDGHQRVLRHRVHAITDHDQRRETLQHGQVLPQARTPAEESWHLAQLLRHTSPADREYRLRVRLGTFLDQSIRQAEKIQHETSGLCSQLIFQHDFSVKNKKF